MKLQIFAGRLSLIFFSPNMVLVFGVWQISIYIWKLSILGPLENFKIFIWSETTNGFVRICIRCGINLRWKSYSQGNWERFKRQLANEQVEASMSNGDSYTCNCKTFKQSIFLFLYISIRRVLFWNILFDLKVYHRLSSNLVNTSFILIVVRFFCCIEF